VALAPDASEAVVTSAEGRLSLLEMRRGGAELSSVECGDTLACCATDGQLLVAGTDGGGAMFWDLQHQRGVASLTAQARPGQTGPGPDGLYPPLVTHDAAVNALAVDWLTTSENGSPSGLHFVTAHEDGHLSILRKV
jgi:hypothetical protein